MQVPGGRLIDRLGARRVGLVGLALVAGWSALALGAPSPSLALACRAATGVGTALAFVGGSDYIRAAGGSPVAQGLWGGISLGGGGVALAVVPQVEALAGWRAPFLTALVVALAAAAVLVAGPVDPPRTASPGALVGSLLRDTRLYPFAALHAAGLGLAAVMGNWFVAIAHRNSGLSEGAAGAIGASILLLGIFTRPLGGWLLREHPGWTRPALVSSMLAGAAGTAAILAGPLWLAVAGCVVTGLAAGMPFAAAFTGAARLRPDAPAAAVGVVNGAGALTILSLTPLVGLTFSLPGDGRIGFAALALCWVAAAAAARRV